MKKKIGNLLIISLFIIALTYVGCNYEANTTFPDTTKISFTYLENDGSNDGTITKENTIGISIEITDWSESYTVSWSEEETSFNSSGKAITWKAPKEKGIYHFNVHAYDGKETITAVCNITVKNNSPVIEDTTFDTVTNILSVTASDPDTDPETLLNINVKADSGTLTPSSDTVTNSGTRNFAWAPNGCPLDNTVTLTINVVDDNPQTTTGTISFFYQ
jgi:hypothetical protein